MLAPSRVRVRLVNRRVHAAHHHSATRRAYSNSLLLAGRVVVGIRREDPQRIWERRCPLTPDVVERLVAEDGVDVLVQPCERRVFKMEDFVKAGATPHPTLAPAHILLGIKETPLDELHTDPAPLTPSPPSADIPSSTEGAPRTHLMFSHTHKGQTYNMPLLSRFLAQQSELSSAANVAAAQNGGLPTLIDWELLTDAKGKRTVGFGWFAGVAGVLEGLISTAHLHLSLGVASPFLSTPRPHTTPLPALLASLKQTGAQIAQEGTPKSMGPFVIVVTGSGQVALGALSVLRDTLPVQSVAVEDLPRLIRDPTTPLNKIYVLHATQETYLYHRTSGERATRKAYYADPSAYESRFHELVAPYTTLLINGVGWTPNSPRLMSIEQTVHALERVNALRDEVNADDRSSASETQTGLRRDVMKGRCQSFADISCDIGGGLEVLPHASTLSAPFFSHRPPTSAFPANLPSLQIMAVDILPTALPLEASAAFSAGILPYVRGVVQRYKGSKLSVGNEEKRETEEALERATIASEGKLREKHEWLGELVKTYRTSQIATNPTTETILPATDTTNSSSISAATPRANKTVLERKKTILLLGSGMVAGPTVDEICRRKDVQLILASDQPERNVFLCRKHENATSVTIDMARTGEVSELVKKADVVISLLPVPLHPAVAELCIRHQRHLVTASYISPAMRALHERAVQSDVLLLNEIGLDPGIDHCSALALLAELRRDGKHVVSFTSFCGGLPAPDCADVPLKYKFSWSPRGVLSAALNGARFLVDGKGRVVTPENLLRSSIPNLPVSEVLRLEGLPNRDSLSYASTYNLKETDGLKTLFRGTIRYPGFSQLLLSLKRLGLLDTDRTMRICSYSDLIRASVEDITNTAITQQADFYSALADLVPECDPHELYETINWLSAVDDAALPPPPSLPIPVIDLFSVLLSYRLAYSLGERDLVVLHHEVISSAWNAPTVKRDEIHTSSLEVYGTPEHSAMALCVGLPVAMAALRVLDSGYKETGVRGPNDPAMYKYVLEGLEQRGLKMKHEVRKYVEGRGVESRLRQAWKTTE